MNDIARENDILLHELNQKIINHLQCIREYNHCSYCQEIIKYLSELK